MSATIPAGAGSTSSTCRGRGYGLDRRPGAGEHVQEKSPPLDVRLSAHVPVHGMLDAVPDRSARVRGILEQSLIEFLRQ